MTTDDDLAERVAWLERAVSQLSAQSDPPITLPPKPGSDASALSSAAQEMVLAGNKTDAITQHRLDTGAGLAEAKAAVDSFSA